MLSNLNWDVVAAVWKDVIAGAPAFGLVLTGVGVLITGYQLGMNRKLAKGQFLFSLYEYMQRYNQEDIYLKSGKWPSGANSPSTDDEWTNVSRYMGLFEAIEVLIEDGIISAETADRFFSHRVVSLVKNKAIFQRNLVEQKARWQDFDRLRKRLEKYPVYQSCINRRA